MLTYLLGPILSLLPRRWRNHLFADLDIDWTRATLISGVLCGFGCLLALVAWYMFAIQQGIEQQVDATLVATKGAPGRGATMAMGFGSLLVFALHPLTWTLAYFSAEGIYRGFAALVIDEAPGSGPLGLVDWVMRTAERRSYEKRVPLVADLVLEDALGKQWSLKVESCRPKPLWKYPKVIKYKEDFFQVAGESTGGAMAARPHVYELRRVPAGEAFRGMEIYDPKEVLRAAPPTLGQSAAQALRDGFRLKTLPLVADEIERVVDEKGVFLRVTSCRLKEDWSPGRVIRHEGCFYGMAETYEAESPRPFGFVLQLLPMGVAGRRVIDYSPEDVLKQPKK